MEGMSFSIKFCGLNCEPSSLAMQGWGVRIPHNMRAYMGKESSYCQTAEPLSLHVGDYRQ